jgi:hypothetical protein
VEGREFPRDPNEDGNLFATHGPTLVSNNQVQHVAGRHRRALRSSDVIRNSGSMSVDLSLGHNRNLLHLTKLVYTSRQGCPAIFVIRRRKFVPQEQM